VLNHVSVSSRRGEDCLRGHFGGEISSSHAKQEGRVSAWWENYI